jgi:hypothetical protein
MVRISQRHSFASMRNTMPAATTAMAAAQWMRIFASLRTAKVSPATA